MLFRSDITFRAFAAQHQGAREQELRDIHRLADEYAGADDELNPDDDPDVTVPPVTPAHKVGLGLQDLQTRARRILAEKNAEKAEENTWIGRMIAAENINDMKALIKSRDSA